MGGSCVGRAPFHMMAPAHNIRHQQRTAYGNIAQYTAPLYLVLCCHVVGRLGKAAPFAPNESVAAKVLCDDTDTDTRNFSAQSQVLLIH